MISTHDREIQMLVADIRDGRLLLPEMQRNYVWKSTQVRDFFDSLYHQYPTGHLLVWETEDLPFVHGPSIQGIQEGQRRPQLLLDGQQRLTSLAAVMLGVPLKVRERERVIDIVFNVFSERFEVANAATRKQTTWVSLTRLFTQGTMAVFADLKLDFSTPEGQSALDHLNRLDLIKSYRYRINVLEHMRYDEVTDIFVRINSGGTRLSSADLALAQVSSRWHGITTELDAYRQRVKHLGWELDDTILLRVLTVMLTNQSRLSQLFHSGRENVSVDELRTAWDHAKRAMDHAIQFMIQNCQIDRLSMLPTNYVLVPLSVFFDRYGEDVTAQQARDLQRWLYMALIWSRYSASSESNLDQDITALGQDQPIQRMIQNIEDKVGPRRPVTERELQDQLNNSPYMVLAYVLARRAGAQDWFSGVAIGARQELEYHHIFPKALFGSSATSAQERRAINQIANLAFISGKANARIASKPPSEYLDKIAAKDEARLRAQYMPMDRSLWSLDRFDDFLRARRALLADAINQFLRSLTDEPALWVGSEADVIKSRLASLEEDLRELIDERLEATFGPAAWRQGIPGDVKQTIEQRIEQRERQHPYEQGQHASLTSRLRFAQFGDYVRIIQASWSAFDDVFGDNKQILARHFLAVQDVRNAFAHNREMNRSELAVAEGGLIWIEDCMRDRAEAEENAEEETARVAESVPSRVR